jgi:hypothetical protein
MRKDHPLAGKDAIRPGDLGGVPLISPAQRMARGEFTKWLGDDAPKPNLAATYTLLFNASLLVKAGVGCALCLDGIVGASEESGLRFRPLEPRLEARWSIVRKKYQVFSDASEFFLKKIQAAFAGTQ